MKVPRCGASIQTVMHVLQQHGVEINILHVAAAGNKDLVLPRIVYNCVQACSITIIPFDSHPDSLSAVLQDAIFSGSFGHRASCPDALQRGVYGISECLEHEGLAEL